MESITATIEFLRKAIKRHRELLAEYDLESTSIDEALWLALDGKWEFDNIDLSDL
jgi:hypothetical protein